MGNDIVADAIMAAAADPVTASVAIFLATLLAEDATAIAVGILVSQAILSPAPALSALLAGTIVGDLLLHIAGRHAGHSRWGRATLLRSKVFSAIADLKASNFLAVGAARFIPGMRLPVYFGSGFLRMDWRGCLALIVLTACVWTPTLFWTSVVSVRATASYLETLSE